jgi:hypothetical protein
MLRRIIHGRDMASRDMRYYILPMFGVTFFSLACMLTIKLLMR